MLSVFSLLTCNSCNKEKEEVRCVGFYFVRHGETDWGKEDILKGPQDLALNQVGIDQAKQAGVKLQKILSNFYNPKIITSSLRRAVETANKISEITRIPINAQKDGFKERYYGDYRLTLDANKIPPDAESTDVFEKRVINALFTTLLENHQSMPLVIVSHQKVFECISEFLVRRKERLSQGGIGYFVLDSNGFWQLEIINTK
jgi:broad specificity phosphatase PhoE